MSAAVAMPPVKPGKTTTPSASPATPTAVEFRYAQTDSFVELLTVLRHEIGNPSATGTNPTAGWPRH